MSVLSERGHHIEYVASLNILREGFLKVRENAYHIKENPEGKINLGTSENKLMYDILSKKLSEPELNVWNAEMLGYSDFSGIPEFRQSIADFLTTKSNAATPLDPEKVVVMNGGGSVVEALMFAICNEGDTILTPSPYYGAIKNHTNIRAKVKVHPVHLYSQKSPTDTRPYEMTIEKLESAFHEAKEKGLNVRGLFLINPHNPLGDIYSIDLIKECLHFCHKHAIHIIFDEMYLTSIFKEEVKATSILQFKPQDIPDPERTHFIWGFSKDFAMSGNRIGVYYGFGERVKTQVHNEGSFTSMSPYIQTMLAKMLQDKDWLDNVYIPTNLRRLRESHEFVCNELTREGIPHLKRSSGLFIYADFRNYMDEHTFEMEKELWHKFLDAGVYITPSAAFYSDEPGWFRIVFSKSRNELRLGMKRIVQVCKR